ncbi:hypothetical protein H105_01325 [Trichophyton soudanense CBS 452.61]|uniref:Uncharacterized protein n=1 Tax=Trichophyton soudanense CBS 452.61 TaxID=1215331 RepID=A0A022Y3X2_TRISD|nr:hypothetical protein H105_01325 [Trichophyton soudanense CBS 452.61]EZG05620.1 hypothetical protein H106_04655 [Trichophyton rubrum CBS 735.88]
MAAARGLCRHGLQPLTQSTGQRLSTGQYAPLKSILRQSRLLSNVPGGSHQLFRSVLRTSKYQQLTRGSSILSRSFSSTSKLLHGHITKPKPGEEIKVTFIDKDGERHDFEVAEGDNLLDIAQANDLEMEGLSIGSIIHAVGPVANGLARCLRRLMRLLYMSCNRGEPRYVR